MAIQIRCRFTRQLRGGVQTVRIKTKIGNNKNEKTIRGQLSNDDTHSTSLKLRWGLEGYGIEKGAEYIGTVIMYLQNFKLSLIEETEKNIIFEGHIKKSFMSKAFGISDENQIRNISSDFPLIRITVDKIRKLIISIESSKTSDDHNVEVRFEDIDTKTKNSDEIFEFRKLSGEKIKVMGRIGQERTLAN